MVDLLQSSFIAEITVVISCLLSPDGGIGRRWSQTPVGNRAGSTWLSIKPLEKAGFSLYLFYSNHSRRYHNCFHHRFLLKSRFLKSPSSHTFSNVFTKVSTCCAPETAYLLSKTKKGRLELLRSAPFQCPVLRLRIASECNIVSISSLSRPASTQFV
jgi:hypothetical protein